MMEYRECVYVQELLPLYTEEVCSEECSQQIRQHLQECSACRERYEADRAVCQSSATLLPHDSDGPQAPFRRLKRHYRFRAATTALAAIAVCATVLLTFGSIGGDGIGWGSIFGWRCADKAMEAIVAKDAKAIARYVDFQSQSGPQSADEMIEQLEVLEQQGVSLLEAKDQLQPLDDGFVYCAAHLTVAYKDSEYRLNFIGQYTGKAAFAYPQEIWMLRDGIRTRVDLNEMPIWMEELCRTVSTYNPG